MPRRILTRAVRAFLAFVASAAVAAVAAVAASAAGFAHGASASSQRIVSMLPSLTETVCALGHCANLVAVDRYSNWPASVRELPQVGSLDGADIEKIVALKPDLVLISTSSRLSARLQALGIQVVGEDPHTFADVTASITRIAALLGEKSAGEQLLRSMEEGIAAAAAAVPPSRRGATVYFEVDAGPYAAGPASHIGELMTRLGARNIVPASLGSVPRLNPEFIVRADPEVIIVSAGERAALEQRPGWRSIRAVREGRICGLSRDEDDIVARPGPRLPDAARILARCLTGAGGAR